MLRIYELNGLTYQFEEGHEPAGAVLAAAAPASGPTAAKEAPGGAAPATGGESGQSGAAAPAKAAAPRNKSRSASREAAENG